MSESPDGPLWGMRETERWQDTIYLGGSSGCSATRRRKSTLLMPLVIAASAPQLPVAGRPEFRHQ